MAQRRRYCWSTSKRRYVPCGQIGSNERKAKKKVPVLAHARRYQYARSKGAGATVRKALNPGRYKGSRYHHRTTYVGWKGRAGPVWNTRGIFGTETPRTPRPMRWPVKIGR